MEAAMPLPAKVETVHRAGLGEGEGRGGGVREGVGEGVSEGLGLGEAPPKVGLGVAEAIGQLNCVMEWELYCGRRKVSTPPPR